MVLKVSCFAQKMQFLATCLQTGCAIICTTCFEILPHHKFHSCIGEKWVPLAICVCIRVARTFLQHEFTNKRCSFLPLWPACQLASQPARQHASQPACQPASQPARQPASQLASQSDTKIVNHLASQPVCLPISLPASQPTSLPASQFPSSNSDKFW